MEDYYLAADVLERIRKGQERTYTDAEVRARLGLEGIYNSTSDAMSYIG